MVCLRLRRPDDRNSACVAQRASQLVSVIAFVGKQVAHAASALKKGGRGLDVIDVARRQHQRMGATDDVGERVDLGRPATTRAADRLRRAPGAKCGTLGLHIGAVDCDAPCHRACIHQGVEQLQPEATVRSAIEPVVDRRRRPVIDRAIAPAAAHFQHMQNAGDHPSVVYAPGARLVLGQVRLNCRPRFVRKAEQRHARSPMIHSHSESGKPLHLNPLMEFGPYFAAGAELGGA